jgi:outer membrane lipoprotein SlyB
VLGIICQSLEGEQMNRTMIKLISPCLAVLALGGCARNIDSGTYKASAVGEASFTYQGVVASARKVHVDEGEYLGENQTGIALGAVGGGLAGSQIGHGTGSVAAALGGAAIGGLAGAFAEKALKAQDGMEYAVKLTNGSMMTVVQGLDNPLAPGQRVLVMVSQDGRSRVVPDQSGYQDVQPMVNTPKQKTEVSFKH